MGFWHSAGEIGATVDVNEISRRVSPTPPLFKRFTYIAQQCIFEIMIEKELVAASTEPLILSLLAKGESYGYELIQEIKELSGDEIKWTDGMLYPVLHRMENNGWIKSRWVEMENGRKRKYYSIKNDGHQALKDKREQWTMISSVLGGLWKGQHV